MDSRLVRSARARQLAAMLLVLEERGGDELAVLAGIADGFVLGLDSHGPLDLDQPRDWDREIDQELRDTGVYRACKREAERRARVNAIAARPDDELPRSVTDGDAAGAGESGGAAGR